MSTPIRPSPALVRLLASRGLRLSDFLGSGSQGEVWRLNDGRVVKRVGRAEAQFSEWIRRARFALLPRVDFVQSLGDGLSWIVVRENLADLDAGNLCLTALLKRISDLLTLDARVQPAPLEAKKCGDHGDAAKNGECSEIACSFIPGVEQLVRAGIRIGDLERIENWGQRPDGTVVIRDIGWADSADAAKVSIAGLPGKAIRLQARGLIAARSNR